MRSTWAVHILAKTRRTLAVNHALHGTVIVLRQSDVVLESLVLSFHAVTLEAQHVAEHFQTFRCHAGKQLVLLVAHGALHHRSVGVQRLKLLFRGIRLANGFVQAEVDGLTILALHIDLVFAKAHQRCARPS